MKITTLLNQRSVSIMQGKEIVKLTKEQAISLTKAINIKYGVK